MSQSGRNVSVAYKAQSGLGVPASGSGGKAFRFNSGAGGLALAKTKIRSNESRPDGQSTLGRHGSRSVGGGYPADASLGTFDDLLEALIRSTWATSLVLTAASGGLTNITITAGSGTTSLITAGGGSWITQGLRLYDVIRLSGTAQAANNGRNLRIIGLTATVITVAETLTPNGVDAGFTVTRSKKLVHTTPLVKRYFTFEEYEADQDASQLFTDCVVSSLAVRIAPDAMATLDFGIVGRDMQVLEGAASPQLTGPTSTTSLGLVASDMTIRLGTTDIASLTGVDFTINLNAATQPVAGKTVSPDVYGNNTAPISGTITGIRDDMALLKSFANEDQLALTLLLVENETEPKDFISIALPLLTLDGNTKNFGADGPLIQTIPFEAGKLLSSVNADLTMVHIETSAP